ncbi:MAG: DUF6090 family protein [Flavobacteriales bacterium]
MKAFNKTRQRLLGDGRLKRYLLYAFGEIVLVVVGILIALQLNAWKAEAKDRGTEQTYLKNLRKDLLLQLEVIDSQNEHEILKVAQADSAMTYFSSGLSLDKLEHLLIGRNGLYTRKTFVANRSTFEDLVSTGNMALIRSAEVKEDLMRYMQLLEYFTTVINNNNIVLIDQQFGENLAGNALGFTLNADGTLDTMRVLDPGQRYQLKTLLERRRLISDQNIDRGTQLKETTGKMIAVLDRVIKPD